MQKPFLALAAWAVGLMAALLVPQATSIISSGTLPANCTVGNLYAKTGVSEGLYVCLTTDVWTGPLESAGGGADNGTFGITIDGGGDVITTGVKGFIEVPFSGTITQATLLSTDASATSGSIVIDVWCDTYANYAPTDADSITDATPPTLSAANKSQDATLTGWDTAITAGAVCGFNVDSASTVTRVTLILTVDKS